MSVTFSGIDVAVANTYSKATLRVAAELFSRNHTNVDYFPSFDMVTLSSRQSAYQPDCLQVADQVVQTVITEFLLACTGKRIAASSFNEFAFLSVNPDVEAAVRRGEFDSGFEYWSQGATPREDARAVNSQ